MPERSASSPAPPAARTLADGTLWLGPAPQSEKPPEKPPAADNRQPAGGRA